MSAGAFKLTPSEGEPRSARLGDCVAYYTAGGGSQRGRWVRAMTIRRLSTHLVAIDEEGDIVHLQRWELCKRRPPVLKPAILADWIRCLNYFGADERADISAPATTKE